MHHNKSTNPKIVSIDLKKAASSRSLGSSPEKGPQKFKMPLKQLKKTLGKGEDVFDKIKEEQNRRRN